MVLVRLQQVELAFGDHVLLDKVDLDVQSGERLCVCLLYTSDAADDP